MKTLLILIGPLLFLLFIIVVVYYGPKGCEQLEKHETQSMKKANKEHAKRIALLNGKKFANHIANNVIYVKDKRTGICFAVYSHVEYHWARGYLAAVDCKKAGL